MSVLTVQQIFAQATLQHQAGGLAAAETLYRQVLRSDPSHAAALHWLGVILAQRGELAESQALLAQSVERDPALQTLIDHGAVLAALGRSGEAERAFERALVIAPAHESARRLLGELRFHQAEAARVAGRADDAIARYRAAIDVDPTLFEAFANLSQLLQQQGQPGESLNLYRRAAMLRPGVADVQFNLGNKLSDAGLYLEATEAFEAATALQPDFAHAFNNLGNVLWSRRLFSEAKRAYERAAELMPELTDVSVNIAAALYLEGDLNGATHHLRKAIAHNPTLAEAHLNLGNALKDAARIDEAIAAYRRGQELQPISSKWSNLLYALHFHPALGAKQIAAEHAAWNRACILPLLTAAPKPVRDWTPERPLRVGYVSGDFREHPVGRFILPLLSNHDRMQFQVYCYSDVRQEVAMTQAFKQHATVWRSTVGMSDEKLAERISADQIDILVELAMHADDNRMLTLARKPAPVQVTYLAYCSTTGSQAIDYRFTDPYLDPSDADQPFYAEQSIRLRSYWCYAAIDNAPPIGPLPAASNHFITFGCLNSYSKASLPARQAWSEILRQVPESRLVLYAPRGSHRDDILAEFSERGIDSSRIEFVGYQQLQDYLTTYNRLDIVLDPFPFPGGTTSCDALWMGVPVVTFAGRTAVSRGGASVLSNAGHPELIATNVEQYITIATALASDQPRLNSLRTQMREQMRRSTLMDQPGFARDVERMYREMWRSRCAVSLHELGNRLQEQGDSPGAVNAYRRALAIRPNLPETHNNLGVALRALGQLEESGNEFAVAARLKPDYADAQNNLAVTLRENGKLDESVAAAQKALSIKPGFLAALITLGNAYLLSGDLDAAINCFRQAIKTEPQSQAYDNYLYTLNLHPSYSPREIAQELSAWQEIVARPIIPVRKVFRSDRALSRRLRVGFVSPDLRDHTVGRFILPYFAHHDPSQIEIVAYAEVAREDWMTEALRRFTSIWRDTRGVRDDVLARQIEADQVDVLIDLAMHCDGSRLVTFALRPAPVQASYLAYPGSTGLETIDYRITDPFLDPPGCDESIYPEAPARLETFWCYAPPPGIATPARRPAGSPITFGCLNNFFKVNEIVLKCWAEVLRRVDDSTLLIHSMEGAHRERIQNFFAATGIDPNRISFIGPQKLKDYFATYSQIDIGLDPFPFGGGTTTCDALWMGVPVVTFAGRTACSRGGASIYNQIGLQEFIAMRAGEYVDSAVNLASDSQRRKWLRENLRDVMNRSPLMDAPRFARNFESLLRAMWQRYCQQA